MYNHHKFLLVGTHSKQTSVQEENGIDSGKHSSVNCEKGGVSRCEKGEVSRCEKGGVSRCEKTKKTVRASE